MQLLKLHSLGANDKLFTFEMRKMPPVYVEFGPKSCGSHLIAISSY